MATMDDISTRVLAQLEPDGLDAEGQSWQQRKSVQTRITILEAAIDCLQKHGYGRTTTQLIAEIAGISRGAMLHHYATKQELIDSARVNEMAGIEISWRSFQTREFAAFLELAIAARTDPDLAEIFLPKARRFDQTELAELIRAFPEWVENLQGYALAMDFCNAAFEGLVINRDIWDERDQRALCTFVGKTIAMLRTGELSVPA